jgi:hypothetical protein
MRFSPVVPVSLIAMLGALVPTGIRADVPPVNPSSIAVWGAGPAAVHVAGTVAANAQLRAILYASRPPDLPNVLLSRRSLKTDAGGHFDAILPTAPAYAYGTTITVIVQTAAGEIVGRGSVTIGDPSLASPSPDHPSSPTH